MAALVVSDMQASPSPQPSSHSQEPSSYPYPSNLSTEEATQAFPFSQHLAQYQSQDDVSSSFQLQSPVAAGIYGQQPQLEPPTSSSPSHGAASPQRLETRRANIACQHCRRLKVRCVVVLGNVDCKRCLQKHQTCQMIEPKRKRAKKADKVEQKIADLESRIHGLTQDLADTKAELSNENSHLDLGLNNLSHSAKLTHIPIRRYQASLQYPQYTRDPYEQYGFRAPHALEDHDTLSRKRMPLSYENQSPNTCQPLVPAEVARYSVGQMDENPHTMGVGTPAAPAPEQNEGDFPSQGYPDLLRHYIPDENMAYRIFYCYETKMAPQIPIVVFPDLKHPAEIMITRPILFQAIICVAAPPEVQAPLSGEFLRMLSHLVIVEQVAHLELIQALQVFIMWFWPTSGRDARCSQYCSIACTMAISLGMNMPSGEKEHWSLWSARHSAFSEDGARAYVGCFILGSMCVKRSCCLFAPHLSW